MKYAVLVKHMFRDIGDVRIEIVEVPRSREDVGPEDIKRLVAENLLGPFEIIAVTDRVSVRDYEEHPTGTLAESDGAE